jgi:hypothetical protein
MGGAGLRRTGGFRFGFGRRTGLPGRGDGEGERRRFFDDFFRGLGPGGLI